MGEHHEGEVRLSGEGSLSFLVHAMAATVVVSETVGLTDHVQVTMNGVDVGATSQAATMWAQLMSLEPAQLWPILGWMWPATVAAIADPKEAFIGTLVMLPLLVLVLRAIVRKHQGGDR